MSKGSLDMRKEWDEWPDGILKASEMINIEWGDGRDLVTPLSKGGYPDIDAEQEWGQDGRQGSSQVENAACLDSLNLLISFGAWGENRTRTATRTEGF